MSYRDRQATASFKGIEFLTDSHDNKGGRRLVVKQYPGSEIAEVEDMGGKAGEFRLNAYFIGPDYDLACDRFMAALNKPGADWLTHPWLGRLWVRARDWSRHESNKDGGMCTVSIDFVPGGGDVAAPTADRVDLAVSARKKFADTVQAEFKMVPMSAASMTSMIAKVQSQLDHIRNVMSLATLPLTMMSQVRNVIDGVKNDIAALLALPAQYASQLRSFSDLLGGVDTSSGSASATSITATGVTQVVDNVVSIAQSPAPISSGVGDSPELQINLTSENNLRSHLLLASAAQVALADYQSADDRDAALASVLKGMDKLLPTMSDPVFQAALDCRATLIDALLAQDLEPASVRDIVQPLPATLLAHRMEVDEAVFLARNKVRHPLFVRGRVYG